jgi:hypothetical protein
MALLEDRTAVFIVRIWREHGDADSAVAEWRGTVEHVESGQRGFFRHLDLILEFMKPHLRAIGIDAEQRFWERISSAMETDEAKHELEFRLDAEPKPKSGTAPATDAASSRARNRKSR